jgi:hypothetical protein
VLMPATGVAPAGFAGDCVASGCGPGSAVRFRQGPYFNHALPAGFEVAQEDNKMLFLRSRDRSAGIMVSGATGLKEQTSPELFAFQWMSTALRLANVRLLGVVYINPMAAYETAAILNVSYTGPDGLMHGVVISNIANFHRGNVYLATDGMVAVVGSKEPLWEAYADWLALVALQAIHNGPDPFGNSSATVPPDTDRDNPEAIAQREWARKTWDEFVDYRAKVVAARGSDTASANKRMYDNPYGGPPIEQSASPAAIWIKPDGQQLPTDNPAFDPRTPADPDWQRLVPR